MHKSSVKTLAIELPKSQGLHNCCTHNQLSIALLSSRLLSPNLIAKKGAMHAGTSCTALKLSSVTAQAPGRG